MARMFSLGKTMPGEQERGNKGKELCPDKGAMSSDGAKGTSNGAQVHFRILFYPKGFSYGKLHRRFQCT